MYFCPVAACRNVTKLRANATRASRRVAACRDRVGDTISLIINYKCFCHPVAACRNVTKLSIKIIFFNTPSRRVAACRNVTKLRSKSSFIIGQGDVFAGTLNLLFLSWIASAGPYQ